MGREELGDTDRPRVLGSGSARVKELSRSLRRRGPRSPVVVLEGRRTVLEAIDAGVSIRTVIVPESAVGQEPHSTLRDRLGADVEMLVVRDRVFGALSSTVTPQPVLAVASRPVAMLPSELGPDDVVLILVGVSDPGNVGTLIRVAEAVAAWCVVVSGGADPWGDKAVRASAGSVLRVPVVTAEDVTSAIAQLRAAGATIVGTDVRGGSAHDRGLLKPPVAIVLGSEAHGLAPALVGLADHVVHIQMPGRTDSLNVAMAGTLLAFETRRAHGHATRSDSSG